MSRTAEVPCAILHRKGRENYVVCFDRAGRREAQNTIVRWAMDPELSFDWKDQTRVAKQIRSYVFEGQQTAKER